MTADQELIAMPTPNPHKIKTLDDLKLAVDLRRSLRAANHLPLLGRKCIPASWIWNMNASRVHCLITQGLFIYVKPSITKKP